MGKGCANRVPNKNPLPGRGQRTNNAPTTSTTHQQHTNNTNNATIESLFGGYQIFQYVNQLFFWFFQNTEDTADERFVCCRLYLEATTQLTE
jgi:hypothetical protein